MYVPQSITDIDMIVDYENSPVKSQTIISNNEMDTSDEDSLANYELSSEESPTQQITVKHRLYIQLLLQLNSNMDNI
ncbi:hypothetical protein RMATCC62417_14199 [Rhizopus microsporus]|nr:hypothetical protein RMATCC62417_14199 [Rhizopus microsporus]